MEKIESKGDYEVLVLAMKNPRAFEVLVDRYQEAFIRKIMAIAKNRDDAEDVVQDTFVKIYTKAHKFSPQEGASFKSWAYKILLNTCYTHFKKQKREHFFVSAVDQETLVLASAGLGEYESKLELDHFLAVISKIPESAGKLLKRVVLEGKGNDDLAREDGVSLGAVRTRLHRARREFQRAAQYF